MKLWLVRHARPLIEPGVCYGALDVPADEAATRTCAAQLAASLPMNGLLNGLPNGAQQVSLSTSTLQRCELLTNYLCGLRPDLAPISDEKLAEMNFGSWEGQRWDAIGEEAVARWTGQFATHCPGGGESVQAFMKRVETAMAEVQGENTVWITHAGVIRAAALIASGVQTVGSADQWPVNGPGYGETVLLEL
ncbi:MAG: hypothetical protein RL211_1439 [Pseudomonadota bacterium]|jgi:alpha-ribazole phosphatase